MREVNIEGGRVFGAFKNKEYNGRKGRVEVVEVVGVEAWGENIGEG